MKDFLRVTIPATSANLGPGFDCLGAAVSLYNKIFLKVLKKNEPSKIVVQGFGKGVIPENHNNLVFRIIRDLFLKNKRLCPRFSLELINNIPVARGLGSSAAAIVGALKLGNELLDNKYSQRELINKAVKIEGHADNIVPAFVGGLCITRINDDSVLWWRQEIAKDLCACVCMPEFSVVTKDARKLMPLKYSSKTSIFTTSGAAFFVASVTSKQSRERDMIVREAMTDKFHQPHRKKLIKGMEKVFFQAKKSGAIGVALSGSGPSIIAVARKGSNTNRIGKAMVDAFRDNGVKSEYKILQFVSKGVY
ncbi:MAG: homoserine kinase [bacterium]